MSLGGWIAAGLIGLLLYLIAPVIGGKPGQVMRIVGVVFLVLAAVLLILWLVGLLTGAATVSLAALSAAGAL